MKRTSTLIGILILAASAPVFGQCPGGSCSRAAYWTPWGYYYSNPSQGGKCNTGQTTKSQTENGSQAPMPEPPADPEPDAPEPSAVEIEFLTMLSPTVSHCSRIKPYTGVV